MGVLLIRRLGRAAGSPGGRQAGGLAGGVLLERHAPPLPDRGGEGGTQIAASRSQRARARRPGAFFPLGLPGGGRPLCATFRDEKALSDSDLGFVPWPLAPSRQGGRPQPARLPHAGCCPCPGASTDGGGGLSQAWSVSPGAMAKGELFPLGVWTVPGSARQRGWTRRPLLGLGGGSKEGSLRVVRGLVSRSSELGRAVVWAEVGNGALALRGV